MRLSPLDQDPRFHPPQTLNPSGLSPRGPPPWLRLRLVTVRRCPVRACHSFRLLAERFTALVEVFLLFGLACVSSAHDPCLGVTMTLDLIILQRLASQAMR
jgi:hypothetical protein